ncbi:MAG TPA: hypothetical protein VD929_00065 [Caulobacteraceae bacterium]|nr:hypothetical protein [Caulobacteraceae bacterium]
MKRTFVLLAASAALVGACATTEGQSVRDQEYAKLKADCEARNGILVPTGAMTGKAPVDYACDIKDSGGRV